MSKNFRYFDDLIHSETKEIVLDSDIILDNGEEEFYGYKHDFENDEIYCGIIVDVDDLIIDGNGHTIDAREKSRIFKLIGKNILIKNITIKNSGPLENFGGNVTIIDSTFTHNLGYAGAIFNHCGKIAIINCKFIDNEAMRNGGAILNRGEMNIVNSLFQSNDAYHWGGAIENQGKLDIKESTFINNFADYDGGAICDSCELKISGSTFSNNISGKNGGAIYTADKAFNLKDCAFKDNEPNDVYKYD